MNRTKVAIIKFETNNLTNTEEEVLRRLDDGNDFPGFEMKKDEDQYVLYYVG